MLRSSADVSPSKSSSPLIPLFKRYQDSFFSSLQRFLETVTKDDYIQQMFQNQNSANYVPNRLCELIGIILRDDREKFLLQVLNRLSSIEACFGPQRSKKFEEIGAKIIENSQQPNPKDFIKQKLMKEVNDQLNSMQIEIMKKQSKEKNKKIWG